MSIPITLSDFIQALLRVIPIQPGVVEISNHKLSIWRVSKLCAVVFFLHMFFLGIHANSKLLIVIR